MQFRRIHIQFFLFIVLIIFPHCTSNPSSPFIPSQPLEGAPALEGADPFDLNLTLPLARLSLQAYQMLTDFQNKTPFALPAPFTLVQQFYTPERFPGEQALGDTEVPIAFIATEGKNIYLVFRGTKTITEWIDDADFSQKDYSFLPDSGLTETGFTNIYASVDQAILEAIQKLLQTGSFSQLYVTGHSLGAALAVLAAPQLETQSGLVPKMYNFAGPRVGNPFFSTFTYGSRVVTSWRVANTNDLVPTLPEKVVVVTDKTQIQFFYYEHVSQLQSITFGQPITGPTDLEDIEANHSLCNYYNFLCQMTPNPQACMALADGADGCNINS